MNDKNWSLVESLFEQAIERPESERAAFLKKACESAPELYDEVWSLVQSHEHAGSIDLVATNGAAIAREIDKLVDEISRGSSLIEGETRMAEVGEDKIQLLARTLESIEPDLAVIDFINVGGTGVVFKAMQKSLAREVAVKVLLTPEVDDKVRQRFIRESKASAKVRSEHVVDIHSVNDSSHFPFLVMELIDGPSLKQLIRDRKQLKPQLAAEICRQIAVGLSAAHQRNLIHRDVKPANVILAGYDPHETHQSQDFRAKLIDFGIVRDMAGDQSTLDELVVGTPAYMSPEQLFNPGQADHRSDVYGLGVTLYQMLTGALPFVGAPHMIMRQVETRDPVPPRRLDDRIPKDLESICLKAMHKNAARRYPTAQAMEEDFARFLAGRPTVARPIPATEKLLRWCNRNRGLATAVSVAALLAIGLVIGSLFFAFTVNAKNREILTHQNETFDSRIQNILNAEPGRLTAAINEVTEENQAVLNRLGTEFGSRANDINRRFNAAIAMSVRGDFQTEFIVKHLDEIYESPTTFENVFAALDEDPDAIPALLRSLADSGDPRAKAKRIILLAQLGSLEHWQTAAEDLPNPVLRTAIIHMLPRWHGDLESLSRVFQPRTDERWTWTFCEALCLLDRRSLNQPTLTAVRRFLDRGIQSRHYPVARFCQLAIRNLFGVTQVPELPAGEDRRYLDEGIMLVRIDATTTEQGRFNPLAMWQDYQPHRVTITRPFLISDAEISIEQFREFAVAELGCENETDFRQQFNLDQIQGQGDRHPMCLVSWYQAVMYCNWLSKQHGLQPVYTLTDKDLGQDGGGEPLQDWVADFDANGFRLPTEAEFELADRNHSTTPLFYGHDRQLFELYAIASGTIRMNTLPIRSKLPNSNGLHDMLGNVWEWVHDRYTSVDGTSLVDPRGPSQYENQIARTYRGGGVRTMSGIVDSESRGQDRPSARYNNVGFRVLLPCQ